MEYTILSGKPSKDSLSTFAALFKLHMQLRYVFTRTTGTKGHCVMKKLEVPENWFGVRI